MAKTKKNPEPTPVNAESEITEFRKAAARYREVHEKVKLFEKEEAVIKPVIVAYVGKHGETPEGRASQRLVDEGVAWQLVPGAWQVDDDAGVAALRDAIRAARGDRRAVLEACIVTVEKIDKTKWEAAKAAGHVPEDVRAAYETRRSTRLVYDYVDRTRCPKCDVVVQQQQRYCHECGTALAQE